MQTTITPPPGYDFRDKHFRLHDIHLPHEFKQSTQRIALRPLYASVRILHVTSDTPKEILGAFLRLPMAAEVRHKVVK